MLTKKFVDFLNDLEKNNFRYTLVSPDPNLNCEDDKYNQIALDLDKNDENYKIYFETRKDAIYLYKIVCTTLKEKRNQSLIYEHMNLPYGLTLSWHVHLINGVLIVYEHAYANLAFGDFSDNEETLSDMEFQLSKEADSLVCSNLENILNQYFKDHIL